MLEPVHLLSFLGGVLEGDPGDNASCDLHDPALFPRGCKVAPANHSRSTSVVKEAREKDASLRPWKRMEKT